MTIHIENTKFLYQTPHHPPLQITNLQKSCTVNLLGTTTPNTHHTPSNEGHTSNKLMNGTTNAAIKQRQNKRCSRVDTSGNPQARNNSIPTSQTQRNTHLTTKATTWRSHQHNENSAAGTKGKGPKNNGDRHITTGTTCSTQARNNNATMGQTQRKTHFTTKATTWRSQQHNENSAVGTKGTKHSTRYNQTQLTDATRRRQLEHRRTNQKNDSLGRKTKKNRLKFGRNNTHSDSDKPFKRHLSTRYNQTQQPDTTRYDQTQRRQQQQFTTEATTWRTHQHIESSAAGTMSKAQKNNRYRHIITGTTCYPQQHHDQDNNNTTNSENTFTNMQHPWHREEPPKTGQC